MRKFIGLQTLLLLCALAIPARADTLPAYAPVKRIICRDCRESTMFSGIQDMIPKRGIVTTEGSLSNIETLWTIVDFDSHKLTRLTAKWDKSVTPSKLLIGGKTSVALTDDQMKPLILAANSLWSPPGDIERPASSSVMVSISLLDDPEIYDDSYVGLLPPALSDALGAVKTPPPTP